LGCAAARAGGIMETAAEAIKERRDKEFFMDVFP
jgi:hypothetical protein